VHSHIYEVFATLRRTAKARRRRKMLAMRLEQKVTQVRLRARKSVEGHPSATAVDDPA
jgi:hypothetical protein